MVWIMQLDKHFVCGFRQAGQLFERSSKTDDLSNNIQQGQPARGLSQNPSSRRTPEHPYVLGRPHLEDDRNKLQAENRETESRKKKKES